MYYSLNNINIMNYYNKLNYILKYLFYKKN